MRGDSVTLAAWLISTKGEYAAENVEIMGWYSTTVLLICLPVFLTFLAYAGILFYEVATKKDLITTKPITISTTTSKYADTGLPAGTLANPPPPAPIGGGHQPVDLGSNSHPTQGTTAHPPGQNLAINTGVPPTGLATDAIVVEKDTTLELYLWEELLIYMIFHLVGLVFCIQPCLTKRNHNAVGIVIAWIHFPLICGYAFVAVV